MIAAGINGKLENLNRGWMLVYCYLSNSKSFLEGLLVEKMTGKAEKRQRRRKRNTVLDQLDLGFAKSQKIEIFSQSRICNTPGQESQARLKALVFSQKWRGDKGTKKKHGLEGESGMIRLPATTNLDG